MIVLDDKLAPGPQTEGGRYGTWRSILPQSVAANWFATPSVVSTHAFDPALNAAIRNAKDVAVHLCVKHAFCSRVASDDPRKPFLVTGNDPSQSGGGAFFSYSVARAFLSTLRGYQSDIIAHEFGHLIHQVRSGDMNFSTREQQEVGEGLADMFAYDFDPEDAQLGEDGPNGKATEVSVRRWDIPQHGEPLRMADYHCFPPGDDPHLNSEILSHAYFVFAGQVTPEVAGFLLHLVPAAMGPDAGFTTVANAFVRVAAATYPAQPQVAAAARKAFLTDAGLTSGPPACIPVTPPVPPVPTPTPPPPAPTQVNVPNLRGDTPSAAAAALTRVGLRLGTQSDVVDTNCIAIGLVLSQSPAAGTVVAPASAVDIRIGKQPSRPCP
jgi:hypothetical protein